MKGLGKYIFALVLVGLVFFSACQMNPFESSSMPVSPSDSRGGYQGLGPDLEGRDDPWFGKIIVSPADHNKWIEVFGLKNAVPVAELRARAKQKYGDEADTAAVSVEIQNITWRGAPEDSVLTATYAVNEDGSFNIERAKSIQGRGADSIMVVARVLNEEYVGPMLSIPMAHLTTSYNNIGRTSLQRTTAIGERVQETWYQTNSGVFMEKVKLDCRTDNCKKDVRQWNTYNSRLVSNKITALIVEESDGERGSVYVGTDSGLDRLVFSPAGSSVEHVLPNPSLGLVPAFEIENKNKVEALVRGSEGSLLLKAVGYRVVYRIPTNQPGNIRSYELPVEFQQMDTVGQLFEDSRHTIWVGTSRGVFWLVENGRSGFYTQGSVPCAVNGILENVKTGSIFAATACGLARASFNSETSDYACEIAFPYPTLGILEDNVDGSIWMGTESRGLRRYVSGQDIGLVPSPGTEFCVNSQSVTKVAQLFNTTESGGVWFVGEDGNGESIFRVTQRDAQPCFEKVFSGGNYSPIRFLEEAFGDINDSVIYLKSPRGAFELGRDLTAASGWRLVQRAESQEGDYVSGSTAGFHALSDGSLLAGLSDGMGRFANGRFTTFRPLTLLFPMFPITPSKMLEDRHHSIWFTDANADGLFRLDLNEADRITFSNIRKLYGVPNVMVKSGTKNGLFFEEITEEPASVLSADQGLPTNVVTDVLEVSDGSLWVSTGYDKTTGKSGGLSTFVDGDGLIFQSHSSAVFAEGMSWSALLITNVYNLLEVNGLLLAATSKGVVSYNLSTKQFAKDILWNSSVRFAAKLKDGSVLVTKPSSKQVYRRLPEGMALADGSKFEEIAVLKGSLDGSLVTKVLEASDGSLWIGKEDVSGNGLGLFHFSRSDAGLTLLETYKCGEGIPVDCKANAFLESSDGSIWIAMGGGPTGKALNGLEAAIRDPNTGGISVYTHGEMITFTKTSGLPGNIATALAEQKGKTSFSSVWVGTNGGGVVFHISARGLSSAQSQ